MRNINTMEIKSSLLNYKEFKSLKNSIAKVSAIDGKDKFRVKMVEYINDTSDNNDDMFFYEMLPFSRFLDPSDKAIAYTTPEHLIYLNAPGKVGESVRIWDFIYCHECLHQLWDTFNVGDKIKNAGLEYNHELLNIASDCVINDYLKVLRKKEPFADGIFPETLKDKFNVDYDRKNDTQYSLYVKLLNVYEENKEQLKKLSDQMKQQEGNNGQSNNQNSSNSSSNSSSSGSSSGSSSSGSSSGSNNSNSSNSNSSNGDSSNSSGGGDSQELDANSAQRDANEAQKHAESVENGANSKGDSGDEKEISQEQIDKIKDAAQRAKEAANKAKECADNGDKEGERKAAEEARKAAEEAKKEAEKTKDQKNSENPQDASEEDSNATEEDIEDINEIRKNAEEIIKKYKDKLTGYLGDFLKKCESASALKREGLKVNTARGISGWNTQMNKICKAFVKKKIFQKKRQYEKTYSRIRRGSGFVKFGQPIDPGRKIKEDKMDINVAFYVDKSGSMYSSINNVFKAVFYIADALKKYFGKEKVVDKTIFESYAFDTSLHKLQFGKKMAADGGTLSFNKLLDYINKNTKEFLINVIITDAQFSDIDTSTIKELLDEIDGILIFITNTPNETMEDISKKYSTKLHYILADSEFTLK